MKPTLKLITFVAILPGDSGSDFWVFTREVQVKISHPFQNGSLLCLDTITALGLQYVFVRKAGRFIGELASVVINSRERNRRLSHGQLSWSFVDELGFELASRHLWLLTFLKSPKCIFSDGSTYNSWNAAAGITVAGCHELPTIPPSDMSLNHMDSESIDLISFDDELPASTPIAVGGVSDVFVNNSSLNPCDDLLDDRSVSRMEWLLCETIKNMGRIDKLTNEAIDQMKLMNTTVNQMGALSDQFKQHEQKIDNLDQKFNRQEQKFDNLDQKFNRQEQKIDNLEQKFNRQEQKIDKLDQKFDKLDQKIDKLDKKFDKLDQKIDKLDQKFDKFDQKLYQFDQKLDQKFDNLGKKFDIKFHERFDNFERKLDAKFHQQLEQFGNSFINKMDTVIANKLDSAIDKAMQRGLDQLRKTVDLGVANVSGEVRQVGEKLTGFQSAMTDEFAIFRSTVTEHLDIKLQMIDVKLSGSMISRFTTVETNILNRIDFCEISVNRRMDCSDGTIDKLNDKVNTLDNEIQKVDEKVGQLEMKIDINHAIVINRLGVLEGQLGSFIKYQTRFNVTVEQKMQVFNQTTNDHDLAIKRFEKVADRHCEQILELHKMVDWTKAEIRNGCNCDVISQFDQLNNKIDKVSDTLTDKFNSEIDNVSKIVQDRLNFQNDKVVKLDDKFADLVQQAVMSLKTEVVTVKHSVDSKSVDVALCKSRLDVVDKNLTDVITKLKHIPIKNSNVHQSGQNVYPNENQQSMPILVSGNATREQIPSPGQRRVVDTVSRGVTQPKTGVRWSGVYCTENNTSAIPKTVSFSKIQIGHTLGYLNNREDVLKDSGENVPFFGNGNDQKYCDEKAPLMIDFANHGGLRPGIIAFDEIDEQQSPTHPSSDDWNWRSSFKRNFDRLNSSHIQCREISRSYSQRNSQNNVSSKYIRGCHASGDHNHFVKRLFT